MSILLAVGTALRRMDSSSQGRLLTVRNADMSQSAMHAWAYGLVGSYAIWVHLGCTSNALDLDANIVGVLGNLDARSCGFGCWHDLLVDGVDAGEVGHALEEDCSAQHVLIRSSGLQWGLHLLTTLTTSSSFAPAWCRTFSRLRMHCLYRSATTVRSQCLRA